MKTHEIKLILPQSFTTSLLQFLNKTKMKTQDKTRKNVLGIWSKRLVLYLMKVVDLKHTQSGSEAQSPIRSGPPLQFSV